MKIEKQFTNRDSLSIDKYLREISRFELLSTYEEIELAKKIRYGNDIEKQRALETLIKANLRFVVSVAKIYQNHGLSLNDLINDGNIGLIKAAARFDETRGFKFITYAVWWIKQSILQALAEQSRIVRLPVNRVAAINKIIKAIDKFEQDVCREPTDIELYELMKNSSVIEVQETFQASKKQISIDAPLSYGEENKLTDVLPNQNQPSPDANLILESLKTEIKRLLKRLKPRERDVIKFYFGLNMENPLTLEEIGDKFKMTRERVRQIKEKAIRNLKRSSITQDLRPYLG